MKSYIICRISQNVELIIKTKTWIIFMLSLGSWTHYIERSQTVFVYICLGKYCQVTDLCYTVLQTRQTNKEVKVLKWLLVCITKVSFTFPAFYVAKHLSIQSLLFSWVCYKKTKNKRKTYWQTTCLIPTHLSVDWMGEKNKFTYFVFVHVWICMFREIWILRINVQVWLKEDYYEEKLYCYHLSRYYLWLNSKLFNNLI